MELKKVSFVVVLIFLFGISFVFALSSSNYKIDNYAVSDGGDDLSSANYKTGAVVGIVSGDSSSTNYISELGFYESSNNSCFNLNECSENSSCLINVDCVLNDNLCSGGVCDFTNLTISSVVTSGWDANGNSKNLTINLSGDLTFLSGNEIRIYGRNGTQGGNGGILNITRLNGLINTTSGVVYAQGGYSSGSGNVGGNGGSIYLYYWGFIGKFNLGGASKSVIGGTSLDSGRGLNGAETYSKNDDVLIDGLRDVDVTNDGFVTNRDSNLIDYYYNEQLGDLNYQKSSDINNDTIQNVKEMFQIGRQYETRK